MSLKVIKSQIDKFLKSDSPEVIAIKGGWGVGKTYSWKKYLLEAKNTNQISLKKYSYVSLFGLNSLETLKYAIFENILNQELIGEEASVETLRQNTTSLLNMVSRKLFNIFKGIPLIKGFNSAIDSLSFLSIKKTLICIDDLERKGKNLNIQDVLGLVSLLKEQKNCKIVLLLNDGEDGIEEYIKYREKVIDVELTFAPTSEECIAIAYEKEGNEFELLKETTKILGIKNIRVLKKIERLIELVIPLLKEYEQEITYQVIHSLVLFTWCYYSSKSDEKAPTLDFVTNIGYSFSGIGKENAETEEEKRWSSTIQKYGYRLTDELDKVLAESVKRGYFIEEEIKIEVDKKNASIISEKSRSSFSEAWNLYHDSFENNENEVINGLYESFMKNVKHISLLNLNGTVTLFRELNQNNKASELIDFYIKERKEEKELFNLKENYSFGDVKDSEIVQKFKKQFKASVVLEKADNVLERIAGQNSWNPKDEVILANTSVDEFYKLLKTKQGDKKLSSYIRTCLNFGEFSNASEQQAKIANNIKEALIRIAKESENNRLRVKKFGINVER